MIKEQVLKLIDKNKNELKQYHVESLYLFGSVARGDENFQSDVDILVSFDGPATFDHYMDLKFYLEDLLQRNVDLVTEAALRPEIRDFVQKDLIRAA